MRLFGGGREMKDVKVDPEFKALVFPLAEAEAAMLEESLLAEGCRDALVTWHGLLLDGHHRLEICRKHGVEFRTAEVELADRTAAKIWIIKNQFARRNLTPFQRAELALKLEPLIAEQAKKRMLAGKKINPVEILPQGKTRDRLGKMAGVSGRTIDVVKEIIEKGSEEQKELLRKNSEKLFHVASEIKQKERTEKWNEEAKKQKENWMKLSEEDGWRVKYFVDKWGNKCVEKAKYTDESLGNKFAHWSTYEIIECEPKYKQVKDGEADLPTQLSFQGLRFGLEQAIRKLEKLKKNFSPEKIKAVYQFNESAKDFDEGIIYYPEVKGLYKKLKGLMERLGFDEERN
jgi:ParB-like chromosome segregation protein Spo0J